MNALLKRALFAAASVAGIALAVRACMELDARRWGPGLDDAGWAIDLVLLPFVNWRAFGQVANRPLSLRDARNPDLLLLPGKLGYLSFTALLLIISSHFF